jgi:molybdopterin molybdotransferase
MIPFEKALELVLDQEFSYGNEEIGLEKANHRILAEDVKADRDFPPFNRATKDGIAIAYEAVENGRLSFEIKDILPAGKPTIPFVDPESCIEIMTGAVVPYETDTVVMYEHIEIRDDIATLQRIPEKGQNIHFKASDHEKGEVILTKGQMISPAELGILATVGKSRVLVKKQPRVVVISTGNELVDIDENPLPHQIRRSNGYSLYGALMEYGICPMRLHIQDDIDLLRQKLAYLIDEMDILLLSGGVSRGKFDYVPQVLGELGVEMIFHRVAQRPGKPFWFGCNKATSTLVFSFPGNPVSTFLNYYLYFVPWYGKIMGLSRVTPNVKIDRKLENHSDLTIFKGVSLQINDGCLIASIAENTGSGDLVHLSAIHGFIQLEPRTEPYEKGCLVPFISTKYRLGA